MDGAGACSEITLESRNAEAKAGPRARLLSSILAVCSRMSARSSEHDHPVSSRWFIADDGLVLTADELVLRHIDFSRPNSTGESSCASSEPVAIRRRPLPLARLPQVRTGSMKRESSR